MCGGRQFVFFFFSRSRRWWFLVANCAGTKQLTFLLVNEMTLIWLRRENTFHNRTLHMNTQFHFREYVFMRIAMNDHCYVPCICIGHSSILFSFFFCYALLRHLGTFAFHKQFHCVVIVFWCLHIDSKTTMMMMALLANDNRRSEIERVSELGVSAIFCCYYSSCQPKAYHITHILIKNLIIWSNNLSIIIHTICAPLLLLYSKATGTRCSYRRSRRRHTCASGMQYICAALLFLFTKLILPSTILCICLMANLYVNMMCVCLSVCMCVWMCMWIAAPRIENAWKYNIFFLYMTA